MMQATILGGKINGYSMAKNGVSVLSCTLHRDQPELSRYVDCLTITCLEDGYTANKNCYFTIA